MSCELEQMTSRTAPNVITPASQPVRSQLNEFQVSSFNWSVPAEFTPTLVRHPQLFFSKLEDPDHALQSCIQMTSVRRRHTNHDPQIQTPRLNFANDITCHSLSSAITQKVGGGVLVCFRPPRDHPTVPEISLKQLEIVNVSGPPSSDTTL